MTHDNAKTLKDGFEKGVKIIYETLADSLVDAAYGLLVKVQENKEYHNLTGNTLTSYMCGVYIDGKLFRIVSMYDADMGIDRPKRGKLYRGSGIGTVYVEDYDTGKWVNVKKYQLMDTDRDYAENTSRRFLVSYKAKTNCVSFVITTGSEYSEYLEMVKKLDVLTRTYWDAPGIIKNSWKKIPE